MKVAEDGRVYAGPVYADLDERVLQSFHGRAGPLRPTRPLWPAPPAPPARALHGAPPASPARHSARPHPAASRLCVRPPPLHPAPPLPSLLRRQLRLLCLVSGGGDGGGGGRRYLKERGINKNLVEYLDEIALDKARARNPNPEPGPRNPKPATRNPQPGTRTCSPEPGTLPRARRLRVALRRR